MRFLGAEALIMCDALQGDMEQTSMLPESVGL